MTETAPLFAGIGGHHSARARTDEWLTPPSIIDALGGPSSFDLDPCSPVVRPWPTARQHLTVEDNGLTKPWSGRVWLNPPYSTSVIGLWLGRLAHHDDGVALIFARTETDAFFRFVWERAAAVLFLRGRINFHLVDGRRATKNSGAPSVLCAYGLDNAAQLGDCGIEGQFVPLLLPRFWTGASVAQTWREVLAAFMSDKRGPVPLAEIYRALIRHPKARSNRNVEAKIRQELQRGPFVRAARGFWEVAPND
ncbi:DNA N-6-adenine-methyltransferase [Agrobacterium radiobacter]|uniref:DNA N-6-adenine-methyltransferase n=1 Tax=Agrobacterium radiobacter TaxID=362 RepID=UPI003F861AAA